MWPLAHGETINRIIEPLACWANFSIVRTMGLMVIKLVVAAGVISVSSWLAGKRPELAGFIVALPLTTLLALAFSYAEYKDSATSVAFAKSVFAGIPISLLFFIPFLLSDRLGLSFWHCYAIGLMLLVIGYVIHRQLMQWI